ncbi:YeeE/YedE family protein [candidate division WOR-3 bacterium]|nr:YeeE/YedE family protein [candidate division WOR-3 bacterium]
MLNRLHSRKKIQLVLGLVTGMMFGFLLQKGGATDYDVILGQLLLRDFTVVKIMLSAVVVGTLGVHLLRSLGLARLHPKPGSLGMSALGGLLFGVGFGTLGYCPGTVAGAVGNGYLDAILGGVVGILIGTGVFAALFPKMRRPVLQLGDFGETTIPQLLGVNPWVVVVPAAAGIAALLLWMHKAGI